MRLSPSSVLPTGGHTDLKNLRGGVGPTLFFQPTLLFDRIRPQLSDPSLWSHNIWKRQRVPITSVERLPGVAIVHRDVGAVGSGGYPCFRRPHTMPPLSDIREEGSTRQSSGARRRSSKPRCPTTHPVSCSHRPRQRRASRRGRQARILRKNRSRTPREQ